MTHITWLANANLAATDSLGLPRCQSPTVPAVCVNRDGAMTWASAGRFVAAMDTYDGAGYLGHKDWQLPPVDRKCPAYNCAGDMSPMGELFYVHLGLIQGTPVVASPDVALGPFNHIQPYLYWSCEAATVQSPCQTTAPAKGGVELLVRQWLPGYRHPGQ